MFNLKIKYCFIIILLSTINVLLSENNGNIDTETQEEIVLTLKAADCFKIKLDSNEIHWYKYKPDQYHERLNFVFTFAIDKKGWIHIPQIIQIPESYEDLFSIVKNELRIQVFDDAGLIRRIVHTKLPDSFQIDSKHPRAIRWGKQITNLMIAENGCYFLKDLISVGTSQYAQLIVKISSEGKVERLWGALGYPKLIEYTDSIFEYWHKGITLDYLYFTDEGHIGSGSWKCNLAFDQNGRMLKYETVGNENWEQDIVQSITGEIFRLNREFLTVSTFIDRDGETFSYNVSPYQIESCPIQILESGELIVYRIRKSGIKEQYEPVANRPGSLFVWRDKNDVINPYVYVVKEKYLPRGK